MLQVYERLSKVAQQDLKEALIQFDPELQKIDRVIQVNLSGSKPANGGIFITRQGKFINISNKFYNHSDLCDWLIDRGYQLSDDPSWMVRNLSYIRCRNDMQLCYVQLPQEITRSQLYALQEWLVDKAHASFISVATSDGQQKKYRKADYQPEEIIKLISRYYSSGTLYEKLEG